MDCVSPILDIVTRVWDCTANRAVYIRDLQENLNSLRDLKLELENIGKDVEGRADFAEQQQYSARTNQVKGWLQSVQLKLKEADDILQKGDEEIQQKCLGSCCPRHCRTSYKLGKQVIKEINVVQELIKKGHFDVVADKVPRPMIDEMPMEKTVGMDSMFDDVWTCVQGHKTRIIGLYGMGGVGKTTLLKKLNNKFLETSHNFVVVIWVVVSKEVKLDKIQETILNKIGIPKEMWIGLTFSSVPPVLKFMSYPKLQSCITQLSIIYCLELRSLDFSFSTMRRMEHLETLYIDDCRNLREIKICFENGERMQRSEPNCFCNLQILNISDCAVMKNLTWLRYAPRLRYLYVVRCESLEEIIAWDFAGSSEIEEAAEIFSNLEEVYFSGLPNLKSICRRAIPFPSLQEISVYSCQSLRKLPLSGESAKSLKEIKGFRYWWDKLEWIDEATKLSFTSKFQVRSD
ncbi:hypothetical protein Dsin_013537 [Dipteronia sinensis]|uniref:NB-ARC domain-containing protein n=1 Tax=Dipteronia sinensis TaxID=43782 RepID=A0AAE0ALB3_9ROSI|nr:hypothetical protein Dsin_013537 [Dipteronia sinensis]